MIRAKQAPLVMEELTDAEALTKAQAQDERFERNWAWFETHAAEIYRQYRGKCLCIAGQELFVADTPEEVIAKATAAHPEDDGRFTRYIPNERAYRISAHRRQPAAPARAAALAGAAGCGDLLRCRGNMQC